MSQQTTEPSTPPTPTPPPGTTAAGKTYSADELEALIGQRVGELNRKHAAELEQARTDAGKSETQRLEAERDRAVEQSKAAAQKAAPRVASALAQVAAIALGGRPDRAAAIVRQADLDGVAKFDGDEWTVDEEKVKAALGKVLEEYPEWKADAAPVGDDPAKEPGKTPLPKPAAPPASGGDLGGGGSDAVTLDDFKRMSMTERGKLASEKPDEYRRLADAEIDSKKAPRTL